jgi:hypothetical protein
MRWPVAAGLTCAAFAAAAPVEGQSQPPPCSSAVGRPTITVVETGSPVLYASHDLTLKTGGNPDVQLRSVSAPNTHVDLETEGKPLLVSDRAGALPVTAVFSAFEHSGDECTTSASTTAQLAAPGRSKASKLKRPHYVVPKRKLYKPNPTFSFSVKPDKAVPDRSPFTVRARISHRLKLPGKGSKLRTKVYPQRDFEATHNSLKFCQGELLCPRRTSLGWRKEVEIDVRPHNDEPATRGVKVLVISPSGYPATHSHRFFQTPYGVDLQVVQSGRRLARLKLVVRCSGGGQSSKCRFKKVALAR